MTARRPRHRVACEEEEEQKRVSASLLYSPTPTPEITRIQKNPQKTLSCTDVSFSDVHWFVGPFVAKSKGRGSQRQRLAFNVAVSPRIRASCAVNARQGVREGGALNR